MWPLSFRELMLDATMSGSTVDGHVAVHVAACDVEFVRALGVNGSGGCCLPHQTTGVFWREEALGSDRWQRFPSAIECWIGPGRPYLGAGTGRRCRALRGLHDAGLSDQHPCDSAQGGSRLRRAGAGCAAGHVRCRRHCGRSHRGTAGRTNRARSEPATHQRSVGDRDDRDSGSGAELGSAGRPAHGWRDLDDVHGLSDQPVARTGDRQEADWAGVRHQTVGWPRSGHAGRPRRADAGGRRRLEVDLRRLWRLRSGRHAQRPAQQLRRYRTFDPEPVGDLPMAPLIALTVVWASAPRRRPHSPVSRSPRRCSRRG